MQSIVSLLTSKEYLLDNSSLADKAFISCIKKANERYRNEYWHFQLIEKIKQQCIEQKMNVNDDHDEEDLITGYCGFKIQTMSGSMSIIVNESGMVEILAQMNEGEHRHFTTGDQHENDNYNPWFEPNLPWMAEIIRVHQIMNKPPLSASQKRKLRAKRAKATGQ